MRSPTGIPRLYRRDGKRLVSFQYFHRDGRTETLSSAPAGDKAAILDALRTARRLAVDIEQGIVVVGSVSEMIDRFNDEVDKNHYLDQSKDGKAVRKSRYEQLKVTFGKMRPKDLRMIHGYQHMDKRSKEGAPAGANREMAAMQTVCNFAVRWGVLDVNPFIGMMQNQTEKVVRTVTRERVVQFYLWAVRQELSYRTMGCAAMFAYLTGFRAAEVRPFMASGIQPEGVRVFSAKRKRGEEKVIKLREWSPKLRVVVARAQNGRPSNGTFLFSSRTQKAYTKSGWGCVWIDAMFAWIATKDAVVQAAAGNGDAIKALNLTKHPLYFTLNDCRPTAITVKMERRDTDVYDFAAHANPATTHKHYDRRRVKKASATE
jgi:integrase